MPEELSDGDKRQLLQTALYAEYGLDKGETPVPKSLYVEDIFEDTVIYSVNEQYYQAPYKIDEEGKMILGEPKKVTRKTVYEPQESLRKAYAELLQEAGKRNAGLDSKRIKQIVSLCQELLSSEFDEDKVKEALTEVNSCIEWAKTQSPAKVIEGYNYPSSAFAYTPDTDDPDTWKLRLFEGEKLSEKAVNMSAAMLSPGGYSGDKVVIPASALYGVQVAVRAAYRDLGIEDKGMSKWVAATITREHLHSYEPLTEAVIDKVDKGKATVVVIKPGFNATEDRYYPVEMLRRDYKVFEGAKMYADHPTVREDDELPERSIKEGSWVAVLKNVKCDSEGIVTGTAEIIEEWMKDKLSNLSEKGLLGEMGVSINAIGSGSKGKINDKDTLIIERLEVARSVDFVTEPGAGGLVTFYESDRGRDVDLVELSVLREKRPDLVKQIEADLRAEITREVKHMSELDDKIVALEKEKEELTTERDGLKSSIEEAEKAKTKADAQAAIKEAVAKAELPEPAKEALIKRFESAETADGITEAIQAEKDYIAKVTEASKVTGLGLSKPNEETEKENHEALVESFKGLNMSDEEAEIAATGR